MRTDSFPTDSPESTDRQPRNVVRVTHGANDDYFPFAGKSVASVRKSLTSGFSIPTEALPKLCGQAVGPGHILVAGEQLVFEREIHKSVGEHVWTKAQFCELFQITPEELDSWIAQGLKVTPAPVRITETAMDEFTRGQKVESPYLTAEQAAEYLHTTVKGIYSLLERRKLSKLPGSRTVLFTRDLLDAYVRGGEE